MKPPRWRVIVALLIILGTFAAYGLSMWGFGSWTHKLVYEDHNYLAAWLLLALIIIGAFAFELITTGEIKWSTTKRWRPMPPPSEPPTTASKVLELRPDEYREGHQ